jgi:rubrerythrin
MSIYEFAIQMEKDGEAFYRELATKSENVGIVRILTMLADDEAKHCDVLQQMATQASPEMPETSVLTDAKNVFAQMQVSDLDVNGLQVDLYLKAQDIERQSLAFYEEKAEQVTDPSAKALLLKIAEEERRHYRLLDNIVEFVDRPRTWLEDGEFSHLDEY